MTADALSRIEIPVSDLCNMWTEIRETINIMTRSRTKRFRDKAIDKNEISSDNNHDIRPDHSEMAALLKRPKYAPELKIIMHETKNLENLVKTTA